ncbi:MAG TPA: hypothetical protein PK373_07060, partial [Sedimentisphaerales bacterium]|nr:hypothetical protein [Sedimentisphaerales bacterium]
MRKTLKGMCVVVVAAMLLPGCSAGKKGMTIEERRQAVANMEAETLQRLYKEAPDAKAKVENAPGYGVFSNANVNLIFASAGGGYGVVVDNVTKQRTYM